MGEDRTTLVGDRKPFSILCRSWREHCLYQHESCESWGNPNRLMPPASAAQAGPWDWAPTETLPVAGLEVTGEALGVQTSFLTHHGATLSFRSSARGDGHWRCSSITTKPWKMLERRKTYWRQGGDRPQTCWRLEAAERPQGGFAAERLWSPRALWCGFLPLITTELPAVSRGLTLKGECWIQRSWCHLSSCWILASCSLFKWSLYL